MDVLILPHDDLSRLNDDALVVHWNHVKQALEVVKAQENYVRRLVAERHFGSGIFTSEGTHNKELGRGYKLKVNIKFNYSLSESDKPKNNIQPLATTAALVAIAAEGNEGSFIADRLVKWKPELSLTEYRKLDDRYKQHIDKALTVSPGLPELELISPK